MELDIMDMCGLWDQTLWTCEDNGTRDGYVRTMGPEMGV